MAGIGKDRSVRAWLHCVCSGIDGRGTIMEWEGRPAGDEDEEAWTAMGYGYDGQYEGGGAGRKWRLEGCV